MSAIRRNPQNDDPGSIAGGVSKRGNSFPLGGWRIFAITEVPENGLVSKLFPKQSSGFDRADTLRVSDKRTPVLGWIVEESISMKETPEKRCASVVTSGDELALEWTEVLDETQFERFMIYYGPMVLKVCLDILGDHASAEDAFQANFLVFFRQSSTIRDRNALGGWLHEVGCRIARRARTVAAKRRSQERQALIMASALPPDDEVGDREWRPILLEEIHALPPKFRDAILLCFIEGLTVAAAAERLDCPPGTLKSRLSKGRDLLRARLTRRGLAASIIFPLLFKSEESHADTAILLIAHSPTSVASGLIRATIKIALGHPDSVPSQIKRMIEAEESHRTALVSRVGWGLILLLAMFDGFGWSITTNMTHRNRPWRNSDPFCPPCWSSPGDLDYPPGRWPRPRRGLGRPGPWEPCRRPVGTSTADSAVLIASMPPPVIAGSIVDRAGSMGWMVVDLAPLV